MKKLNLYKEVLCKDGDRWSYDWDRSPIFKTIEVNNDFDIWATPILINKTFYTVGCRSGNNLK